MARYQITTIYKKTSLLGQTTQTIPRKEILLLGEEKLDVGEEAEQRP